MSKLVSQIIITSDEPRRNPGTDLWFDPSSGKLYYWNKTNENWQVAISGGGGTTTVATGGNTGGDTGGNTGGNTQVSTTDIIEGSKLFFTDARARAALNGLYVTPGNANETYLSKINASSQYLTQLGASAIYTPLTTFNSQLVAAFAALESLTEALAGFDGDLATALEAMYLKQSNASAIYATKTELQNVAAELDAAAVAYGLAL